MNHVIRTPNYVGTSLSCYSAMIDFLLQNSEYSNDQHRKPGGSILSNSNDDRYTDEVINEYIYATSWMVDVDP